MNNNDEKTLYVIALLNNKAKELGRIPKKTDFDSKTVCLIKQKLGPWPRALEAAKLKKAPLQSSKELSKIKRKRIRQVKRKNENEK